jgi:hypothetical protein
MRKAKAVYFIQRGEDGPIKIGETKSDPADRLKALQIGSAERLRLLGHVRSKETEVHARFSQHRISGEWFRPHQDILDFVRTSAIKPPPLAPRIVKTQTKRERMVGTRVSADLEKKIEEYKARLEKRAPGSQPSMADAVRALIVRGLATAESS